MHCTTHCTDAPHRRTALTNWHTERIRHKRKSRQSVKTADKPRTQGRELVRETTVKLALTQLFFPQLNRELRMDQLTNHRDTWPKVETDWPTTETQDQGQTENKWHKTVYTTQLSDRPPIHALNSIWGKKKVSFHISKLRLTNWFHEKNKSARVLHNHLCKKEKNNLVLPQTKTKKLSFLHHFKSTKLQWWLTAI